MWSVALESMTQLEEDERKHVVDLPDSAIVETWEKTKGFTNSWYQMNCALFAPTRMIFLAIDNSFHRKDDTKWDHKVSPKNQKLGISSSNYHQRKSKSESNLWPTWEGHQMLLTIPSRHKNKNHQLKSQNDLDHQGPSTKPQKYYQKLSKRRLANPKESFFSCEGGVVANAKSFKRRVTLMHTAVDHWTLGNGWSEPYESS